MGEVHPVAATHLEDFAGELADQILAVAADLLFHRTAQAGIYAGEEGMSEGADGPIVTGARQANG